MSRHQRERFLDVLAQHDAAALVFSGTGRIRNHDCEYRFRPDSDFYFLTAFAEPDSVLLLQPGADEPTVLFLRERDPLQETWNGRRLGVEAAPETLGVDAAYPVDEMWTRLPQLLKGSRRLVYRHGEDDRRDRDVLDLCADLRARIRGGVVAPTEIVDPSAWLHELRLFKQPAELELMRRAAKVTTEAHGRAMRAVAPGVNECEIDALLDYTYARRGCTGAAYNNIVAGGGNACILHYVENDQPLNDGQLLLIDSGAEWECYAADVTRTFPVNGSFSAPQRELYELVLRAQKAAIESVQPGLTFAGVHAVALQHLVEGLVQLGLLSGSVDQALETESYERFFMHRTSHWLGLDVHDCGAYHIDGSSRPLEPGMCLTVEPGLYVAPDDESVDPRWRGIGVRIEDDLLVTRAGHEVLTAEIPKEVDAVEATCRGDVLEPALSEAGT